MSQKTLYLLGVFLLVTVAAPAQEAATPPGPALPAASRAEMDCSGFIAGSSLPEGLFLIDGEDNDIHSPIRHFATGDFVYVHSRGGTNVAEGTEYSLVRRGDYLFRTSWYSGEGSSVRSLGKPYEDVGRIKVTRLTPQGAIAEVTFACGPVLPGDLVVPYTPRPIPDYVPAKDFDRFAVSNGKKLGALTTSRYNVGILGTGSIVYTNLGVSDGVKPGDRFRVFRIVRDRVESFLAFPDTPRESVGEIVVLSTQERSSVAIVVNCIREIFLGDGIELE